MMDSSGLVTTVAVSSTGQRMTEPLDFSKLSVANRPSDQPEVRRL